MAIKLSGSTIIDDSRNIINAAEATFTGNVSIGGTLSYEDVTNIDAVGVITARQDINLGGDIIHLNDTNTKFGFPENDTFSVETGGTERLRVKSNGNIAIGANGIASYLIDARTDANPSSGVIALLRNNQGNGTGSFLALGANLKGTYSMGMPDNTDAFTIVDGLGNDGTERLRIDSDGKFGIGTSSLSAQLDVRSSDDPANGLLVFAKNNTSGGNGAFYASEVSGVGNWSSGMPDNTNAYTIVQGIGNNGTERLRIDSNGKFGLGTNNPQALLDVEQTTEGEVVRLRASNATRYLKISSFNSGFNGSGFDFNATSNTGEISFSTEDVEKVRIDNAGNVGIGTNSPATVLDIRNTSPMMRLWDTDATNAYTSITNLNGNMYLGARNDSSDGVLLFGGYGGNTFTEFFRASSTAFTLDTNGNERLRVNSSGNVGINTTLPREKLDISAGRIILDQDYQFTWANETTNRARIYGDSGDNFIIENGSSNTERLRITSDGKVGVNTTTNLNAGTMTLYSANAGEGTATGQLELKDNAAFGSTPTGGIIFSGHHSAGGNAIFAGIRGFKSNTGDGDVDGSLAFDVRKHGAIPYEAMRINEDGNVAIGTDNPNPNSTLHLYNGDGGCDLTITSVDTSAVDINLGDVSDINNGRIRYNNTNNSMQFTTNGSEKVRITNVGNIGIGIDAPTELVSIGTTTGDAAILIQSGTADRDEYRIREIASGGVDKGKLVIENMAGGSYGIDVTLDSDGDVGIGTTDPVKKLHVVGDSRFDGITQIGPENITGFQLNIDLSENNRSGQKINIDSWRNNSTTRYGLFLDIDTVSEEEITQQRNKYGIYTDMNTLVPPNADPSLNGTKYNVYGTRTSVVLDDAQGISGITTYTTGELALGVASYNKIRMEHPGGANNLYASYNWAQLFPDAGSGVAGTCSNVYGSYNLVRNDAPDMTITDAYGVYSTVNPDNGDITNSYAYYGINDRDGGTATTGYLYYGRYTGTWVTKYGLYILDETYNYMSGSLGIGVVNPNTKLHVQGSGAPDIRLQDEDGTNQYATFIENNGQFFINSRNDTSTGAIVFRGENNTDTIEYMSIQSDGKVGVGTESPDTLLHVQGALTIVPGASVTPQNNGDVVVEATNNTTLTFKLKGSDGVVRSGTLTLS